mmetsp:Transcript_28644/g.96458  ORF Transcript_28644/g.96458 Transcript_28644/m.96458 type:complete len:164 (+) Transcript_28644:1472-1963(+)
MHGPRLHRTPPRRRLPNRLGRTSPPRRRRDERRRIGLDARRGPGRRRRRRAAAAAATDALFRAPRAAPVARPSSPAAAALRVRQQRWQRKVTLILLRSHIRRQFASGFNGAAALASLFYVAAAVFARTARNAAARLFYAILARRADGGRPQGAPTLAGPAGAL